MIVAFSGGVCGGQCFYRHCQCGGGFDALDASETEMLSIAMGLGDAPWDFRANPIRNNQQDSPLIKF